MPDHEFDRPDLAELVVPLGRALTNGELPVLREYGLSMWGYVVLRNLQSEPTRSQAALAKEVGADKTRIIAVLDELQDAGLIERTPDPADRRVRLLALTDRGRQVRDDARRGIRAREERLLARLPAPDRAALLRSLRALSELSREEFEVAPE
ncbi:MarR family winged helix-turn-helix transcriptional regulator [Rhodococcus sp. NPDC059234]|uniref:MarR family winged helix-turn-helix transcriptional regulator n=1 Tax=Rhodococcus sp. NPDC059234 TaxID=3346781 RepID=UPI00366B8BB7